MSRRTAKKKRWQPKPLSWVMRLVETDEKMARAHGQARASGKVDPMDTRADEACAHDAR